MSNNTKDRVVVEDGFPADETAIPEGTVDPQKKTMKYGEYIKYLQNMHKVRKLECEIAEYNFRGFMADLQYRNAQMGVMPGYQQMIQPDEQNSVQDEEPVETILQNEAILD